MVEKRCPNCGKPFIVQAHKQGIGLKYCSTICSKEGRRKSLKQWRDGPGKETWKAQRKRYRERHKEEMKKKASENYFKNREHYLTVVAGYRALNKDVVNERNKRYRITHRGRMALRYQEDRPNRLIGQWARYMEKLAETKAARYESLEIAQTRIKELRLEGIKKIARRLNVNRVKDITHCQYRWHDKPGIVYFIQAGNGFVKIGFTTDLKNRLAYMQKNCPLDLRVVYQINDSSYIIERALHEEFDAWHARGEWFHWVSQIREKVDRLKKGEDVLRVLGNPMAIKIIEAMKDVKNELQKAA